MAIIIFISTIIFTTLTINLLLKNPIFATILSILLSPIAFQFIVYIQLGHLDPFAPIAYLFSLLPTTFIATLTTLLYFIIKTAIAHGHNTKTT